MFVQSHIQRNRHHQHSTTPSSSQLHQPSTLSTTTSLNNNKHDNCRKKSNYSNKSLLGSSSFNFISKESNHNNSYNNNHLPSLTNNSDQKFEGKYNENFLSKVAQPVVIETIKYFSSENQNDLCKINKFEQLNKKTKRNNKIKYKKEFSFDQDNIVFDTEVAEALKNNNLTNFNHQNGKETGKASTTLREDNELLAHNEINNNNNTDQSYLSFLEYNYDDENVVEKSYQKSLYYLENDNDIDINTKEFQNIDNLESKFENSNEKLKKYHSLYNINQFDKLNILHYDKQIHSNSLEQQSYQTNVIENKRDHELIFNSVNSLISNSSKLSSIDDSTLSVDRKLVTNSLTSKLLTSKNSNAKETIDLNSKKFHNNKINTLNGIQSSEKSAFTNYNIIANGDSIYNCNENVIIESNKKCSLSSAINNIVLFLDKRGNLFFIFLHFFKNFLSYQLETCRFLIDGCSNLIRKEAATNDFTVTIDSPTVDLLNRSLPCEFDEFKTKENPTYNSKMFSSLERHHKHHHNHNSITSDNMDPTNNRNFNNNHHDDGYKYAPVLAQNNLVNNYSIVVPNNRGNENNSYDMILSNLQHPDVIQFNNGNMNYFQPIAKTKLKNGFITEDTGQTITEGVYTNGRQLNKNSSQPFILKHDLSQRQNTNNTNNINDLSSAREAAANVFNYYETSNRSDNNSCVRRQNSLISQRSLYDDSAATQSAADDSLKEDLINQFITNISHCSPSRLISIVSDGNESSANKSPKPRSFAKIQHHHSHNHHDNSCQDFYNVSSSYHKQNAANGPIRSCEFSGHKSNDSFWQPNYRSKNITQSNEFLNVCPMLNNGISVEQHLRTISSNSGPPILPAKREEIDLNPFCEIYNNYDEFDKQTNYKSFCQDQSNHNYLSKVLNDNNQNKNSILGANELRSRYFTLGKKYSNSLDCSYNNINVINLSSKSKQFEDYEQSKARDYSHQEYQSQCNQINLIKRNSTLDCPIINSIYHDDYEKNLSNASNRIYSTDKKINKTTRKDPIEATRVLMNPIEEFNSLNARLTIHTATEGDTEHHQYDRNAETLTVTSDSELYSRNYYDESSSNKEAQKFILENKIENSRKQANNNYIDNDNNFNHNSMKRNYASFDYLVTSQTNNRADERKRNMDLKYVNQNNNNTNSFNHEQQRLRPDSVNSSRSYNVGDAKRYINGTYIGGKLSLTGAKKRFGFRNKGGLNSLSVQRSEEIFPYEAARYLVSEFKSSNTDCKTSTNTSNGNQSDNGDPRSCFVEGLGYGQIASRQALVSPYLGDLQLTLSDSRGMLEVEVVRARQLQIKPAAKMLPSPYVKMYLLKNKKCLAKCKTNTARRTLNPLYQQQFIFREDYNDCVLQIIVWGDYGKKDRKSLMGIVQIHLKDLNISDLVIGWYRLFNAPSMASSISNSKALRHSILKNDLADSGSLKKF